MIHDRDLWRFLRWAERMIDAGALDAEITETNAVITTGDRVWELTLASLFVDGVRYPMGMIDRLFVRWMRGRLWRKQQATDRVVMREWMRRAITPKEEEHAE